MGFFDDAEVELNDIPDDPFGFGNEHWPIRILEAGEPKVTGNGDKVGMMIKWVVDHQKYEGHQVSMFGMGQWVQLPVPKSHQGEIPWDPKGNPEHQKVLIDLRDLFANLGFKNDEMGSIDGPKMVGRGCMSKIKPKKNAEGFWQFNFFNQKPLKGDGSESGMDEFAKPGNTGGKTAEELLKEELGQA